jgi:hypothetical protein
MEMRRTLHLPPRPGAPLAGRRRHEPSRRLFDPGIAVLGGAPSRSGRIHGRGGKSRPVAARCRTRGGRRAATVADLARARAHRDVSCAGRADGFIAGGVLLGVGLAGILGGSLMSNQWSRRGTRAGWATPTTATSSSSWGSSRSGHCGPADAPTGRDVCAAPRSPPSARGS